MSLETLAAALAFALLRLIYDRTERGRFLARRLYSTAAYPFAVRLSKRPHRAVVLGWTCMCAATWSAS